MQFPNKAVIEHLRQTYPAGTRVELLQMEDVQAPPIGTKGTVYGVDDIRFTFKNGQEIRA